MTPSTTPVGPPSTFIEGDWVVIQSGSFAGTPGTFIAVRADKSWADVKEPDGHVRAYPMRWLRHWVDGGELQATEEAMAKKPAPVVEKIRAPVRFRSVKRMTNVIICFLVALIAVSSLRAADLSKYRKLEFGMTVASVEKATGIEDPVAVTLHQLPVLLQELAWSPAHVNGSSTENDSVGRVLFSFYDGGLYRIALTYDSEKTAGLTSADMIQSISTLYGPATKPVAEMRFPGNVYETVNVVGRWEDPQYVVSLIRFPYDPAYGLILTSKRLDVLAEKAKDASVLLEAKEAPQREAALKQKSLAESREKDAKDRGLNKPGFVP